MDFKAINPLAWTGLRKFLLILAAVFVAFGILTGAAVYLVSGAICIAALLVWEWRAQRRLAFAVPGVQTFAAMSTKPQTDTVVEQLIMVLAVIAAVLGKEIPEATIQYVAQAIGIGIALITGGRDLWKTLKLAWASFRA